MVYVALAFCGAAVASFFFKAKDDFYNNYVVSSFRSSKVMAIFVALLVFTVSLIKWDTVGLLVSILLAVGALVLAKSAKSFQGKTEKAQQGL